MYITDMHAKVKFSKDTLAFDTVFSTFGSATKQLMVYNKYDKIIKLSDVRIANGSNSFFAFNIDGRKGPQAKDIEIGPNDSAYVFVQVLIDSTKSNNPVFIEDSLLFTINGNRQHVALQAWGQDVYLYRDSVIKSKTWTNEKPYVIKEAIMVDSLETLTIEAGTTIYMHGNAYFILKGNLICNGTKENPVVFRGDRLDDAGYTPPVPYDKLPGQWGEILFLNSSSGNSLTYTEIRNANYGIVAGTTGINNKAEVSLSNCKISNNTFCAILGTNAKITASNCILSNSGISNFLAIMGGDYQFTHCTFANYYSDNEKDRLGVALRNKAEVNEYNDTTKTYEKKTYYGDLKNARFENCIIYSSDVSQQLSLVSEKKYVFNYVFDHCLIRDNPKNLEVADKSKYINTRISIIDEPIFKTIDKEKRFFDFQLVKKSAARDAGDLAIGQKVPIDCNGNNRTLDEAPDLGAYEYQNGE